MFVVGSFVVAYSTVYPVEIQTSSFDGHNKGDLFLFLITHKIFMEYEGVELLLHSFLDQLYIYIYIYIGL
jgi:hypothetical protein